jgi:hypothetical protein
VTNISPQECPKPSRSSRELRLFIFAKQFLRGLVALTLVFSAAATIHAQSAGEFVGRIEGYDFTVENPSGAPLPRGEPPVLLSSGNRLIVRAGQARILLEGGGDILICGAAQLQVLKAQGAITIALDYGTLRVHEKKTDPVSVFTPLVLATTVSIGGGERDATVGLEQSGEMCIRAKSGAVRVGQQLSGESLLVPQFGGLTLSGGQINAVSASAPGCTCEADAAKLSPSRPAATRPSIDVKVSIGDPLPHLSHAPLITNPLPGASSSTVVGAPPDVNEPALSVIVPTFVYNASNPDPPEDAAVEMITLVRSVRVREDTMIHGTVEPKGSVAIVPAEKKTSDSSEDHPGVLERIGGFFRRLFGGSH